MDSDATRALSHPRSSVGAVESRDFGHALRTALVARHATLRGLSVALSERDHLVTTPLLAAWRSGAVVPGGAEDRAAVSVLEQLLDLGEGELVRHLDPDATGSTRSRRPGTFDGVLPSPATGQPAGDAEASTRVCDSVQRARTALGFGRAVQQMVETRVELRLESDEARKEWWIVQRSRWSSPAGGVDCVPLVVVTPTPVSGRVRVEPIEGCRLGPSYVDLAEGVFATSLVLPAPLREGDTVTTLHRTHLPPDLAPTWPDERWTLRDDEEVGVVRLARQGPKTDNSSSRPQQTQELS